MALSHGNTAGTKLISAPRSRSFAGPFGRLFRILPPWEPPGTSEEQKIASIAAIANEMAEPQGFGPAGDNERIPAGYTYFGQFVDHDLTFDPRSSLQKQNDPENLEDFRTPAFDLDCLYGRGPDDQPYMYENGRFRIGQGADPNEADLPRFGATALIGDKRNDENTFVSQLQLVFLKFHNAVFDKLTNTALSDKERFFEAQRIVRWHYQWVVVHDWLSRLCGHDVIGRMLKNRDCPSKPNLCYYGYHEHPFMPLEFSVAAYRIGHTMIRGGYRINSQVAAPTFTSNDVEEPTNDFRGFKLLPAGWTVDWSFFFDLSAAQPQPDVNVNAQAKPALSRKLDRFLVNAMLNMPKPIGDPADVPEPNPSPVATIQRSLAFRNLLRGWRLGLPSGESVALLLGIKPTDTKMDLNASTPLWRYILDEAASDGKGVRLGKVGATIVAETFLGILAADPSSYLRQQPGWTPDLGADPIGDAFEVRDIIKFAGGRIGS